jgi:hypothetical protein
MGLGGGAQVRIAFPAGFALLRNLVKIRVFSTHPRITLRMKTGILLLALGGLSLAPMTLRAQTFAEGTDAGITEATAAIVPPGITKITGTYKPGTDGPFGPNPADIDVFAFTLEKTTAVSIYAPALNGIDTNLLLLKEGFFGVFGDDDSGSGFDSLIEVTLPAGTYYLAIGDNNIGAYPFGSDSTGDYEWDNDSDLLDPAEAAIPIAFIGAEDDDPDETTGQAYEITFNFSTVVTGLDLSVGKKPSQMKGVNLLGNDGKGQTARVSGSGSVQFLVNLTNTARKRSIQGGLTGAARKAPFEVIDLSNGKKNVSAAFRSGKYSSSIDSGASKRFQLSLTAGSERVVQSLRPFLVSAGSSSFKGTALISVEDQDDASISDTVGAAVKLR